MKIKTGIFKRVYDSYRELEKCHNIVGIYQFGSTISEQRRSTIVSDPHQGLNKRKRCSKTDIDLLVVAKNKTSTLKRTIDQYLSKAGKVVHHPDAYSPRDNQTVYIEVMVLPQQSHYLSSPKHGILTGLSGFVHNRYVCIYGPEDLKELLPLPSPSIASIERLHIFKHCEWGLNDILTKLWPILDSNSSIIDIRRLGRFLLMDVSWVVTGSFKDNLNAIRTEIVKVTDNSLILDRICRLSKYIDQKDSNEENNIANTVILYDLVLELRRVLGMIIG